MAKLKLDLLQVLLHGKLLHVPALPFSRAGFYADMGLIAENGNAKIFGESFDLPDGEETFFLNLDEFEPDTYWLDKSGHSAWPPGQSDTATWVATDLAVRFREEGLGDILDGNREVKFYRSPRAAGSGLPSRGLLQSAAAISFGGRSSDSQRVLIYATPAFPCSIEVVLDESRSRSIIEDLEEIRLGNRGQT